MHLVVWFVCLCSTAGWADSARCYTLYEPLSTVRTYGDTGTLGNSRIIDPIEGDTSCDDVTYITYKPVKLVNSGDDCTSSYTVYEPCKVTKVPCVYERYGRIKPCKPSEVVYEYEVDQDEPEVLDDADEVVKTITYVPCKKRVKPWNGYVLYDKYRVCEDDKTPVSKYIVCDDDVTETVYDTPVGSAVEECTVYEPYGHIPQDKWVEVRPRHFSCLRPKYSRHLLRRDHDCFPSRYCRRPYDNCEPYKPFHSRCGDCTRFPHRKFNFCHPWCRRPSFPRCPRMGPHKYYPDRFSECKHHHLPYRGFNRFRCQPTDCGHCTSCPPWYRNQCCPPGPCPEPEFCGCGCIKSGPPACCPPPDCMPHFLREKGLHGCITGEGEMVNYGKQETGTQHEQVTNMQYSSSVDPFGERTHEGGCDSYGERRNYGNEYCGNRHRLEGDLCVTGKLHPCGRPHEITNLSGQLLGQPEIYEAVPSDCVCENYGTY